MRRDPRQYERYADERGRPFGDLLARVRAESPRRVVDLGCGPGSLTAGLAERWPDAVVEGLDSSPEMIDRAAGLGSSVAFRVADVQSYTPTPDTDVLVSNATLQWVPGHEELLTRWASELPEGAWLAFQVPGNIDAPSHVAIRELGEQWGLDVAERIRVATPTRYAEILLDAGLEVDVWETTYLHVLRGENPVLEWLRGTGLRPTLAALDPTDVPAFETELAARLREAYPPTEHGTVFPFRRIFAVATKR